MDVVYRYRDGFASAPALLALALLPLLTTRPSHSPTAPSSHIEIVMLAPPELTPSPQPQPTPPAPKSLPRPVAVPAPVAVAPSPAIQSNMKLPALVAESPSEPSRPAPTASPAPPPSTPTPSANSSANSSAELETAYVARVRQMLNAVKRYPTGREASLLRPSGRVRVWLLLDREGRLLGKGIDASSQSLLLDSAALRTVSLSSYPPFPADLWPGQMQHRFHADIDFVLPNP